MKKSDFSLLFRYVITSTITILLDLALITLVITGLTNVFIGYQINNNIYVQQEMAKESISQIIYEVISAYTRIYTSDNITDFVSKSESEKNGYFTEIYSGANLSSDLFTGAVFYYDENVYYTPGMKLLVTRSMVEDVEESDNPITYLSSIRTGGEGILVFGRQVVSTLVPNVIIGQSFFFINHAKILDVTDKITGLQGYSYLFGGNKVISHPDLDYLGASPLNGMPIDTGSDKHYEIKKIDGVKNIISTSSFDGLNINYGFDWHIITIQSFSEMFRSLIWLQVIIIISSVGILGLSFFLAYYLSRKLTRPIKKLSDRLASYNPDLGAQEDVDISPRDELYLLAKTYDQMSERIHDLIVKTKDDAETQRKLELDSLQMQINPHFLYNTLDAIAWIAKMKKESEIEHIVMALAGFFRISLHKGDKFISVEEELELVKHFVEIELFRFPDKFTISYSVTDEVKNYQMLKLLVQPIVENAIKHGIMSLDRMGKISINAFLKERKIYIEIIDDGRGFNPPEDLLKKSYRKTRSQGGYGLYNVNERIKLEYGEEYGLKVESDEGRGTKITMILQARI